MNKKYGHLYVDIREREQEVCDRLMEHVYERLYDIHRAINYCAQIDCLMAMASFSLNYELVRPEMVTDRKILEIKVRPSLKFTNLLLKIFTFNSKYLAFAPYTGWTTFASWSTAEMYSKRYFDQR